MDAQRAMLDALMGKTRNMSSEEKAKHKVNFDDPTICQWYNMDFCPHDLFINTKSDLGPCSKEHDPIMRKEFQEEAKKNPRLISALEPKFLWELKGLVADLDKRMRRGQQRLNIQNKVIPDSEAEARQREIDILEEQISQLGAQMEQLISEGKIDESQAIMRMVDDLKEKRSEILIPELDDDQKMRVCDICGAFLLVHDAEQRKVSHLDGKQHQGYAKIRERIKELSAKLDVRRGPAREEDRRGSRDRDRRPRSRSRSPRRDHRRYDRDRRDYRGGRSRGSDRDRDRRRSRSRSRSRGRRY